MGNSPLAFISVGSKHETHFSTLILNDVKNYINQKNDQLTRHPKFETKRFLCIFWVTLEEDLLRD